MQPTITETELLSQPQCWRRILARSANFDLRASVTFGAFDEVVLFGSGTSYYLALAAADCIEQRLSVRTRVLPSCDVLLFGDRYLSAVAQRLAIGFSRSGESTEGILAAKALSSRGIDVIAVGCDPDSTLMRLARHRLLVPEAQEDGFVMMRSFTSMLLAIQLATLREEGGGRIGANLSTLPDVATEVLSRRPRIERLAKSRAFSRFVFLGSGPDYPLALEAAMKLQESAGVVTEAYRTLEYRHGPRATGDTETLAVLLAPDATPWGIDLVRDLRAQGLATLVIGEDVAAYLGLADEAVELRSGLPVDLRAGLLMLPIHLLALTVAIGRGRNPDRPKNLAKVVLFEDVAA